MSEAEQKPNYHIREVNPWENEKPRSLKKLHKQERQNKKRGRKRGKNNASNYNQ